MPSAEGADPARAPPPPPPLAPPPLSPRGAGGPRHFTHVLLDLDDTLYREERVGACVREHIIDYVAEHLGLPRDEATALTTQLYASHGTTMAGLVAIGHSIEPDHWHGRVHAPLDYEALLARDDALIEMLRRLTAAKRTFVFTNADRRHAVACLRLLGATAENGVHWADGGGGEGYHFENVQAMGAERGLLPDVPSPAAPGAAPGAGAGAAAGKGAGVKGFLAKPSHDVFRMVAEHCGAASPRACVFVDDSVRNVAAARAVGMFGVLVGRRRGDAVEGADACVETVLELPEVLPELFVLPREGVEVAGAAAAAAAGEKEEVVGVAVAVAVAAG